MPLNNQSLTNVSVFTLNTLFASILILVAIFVTAQPIAAANYQMLSHPKSELTANYAHENFYQPAVASLAELITYKTFAKADVPMEEDPAFKQFNQAIARLAQQLDLEFEDHGSVLLVSVGSGTKTLGLLTHGDVQPANSSKWPTYPFELDTTSEPGKLIGRGTEDDKAPIVAAMYAMKAIKDQQIPLRGKVELLIYMAEESDWNQLKEFLKTFQPAPLNIALDSEYPVVTAEKAWSHVDVQFSLPLPSDLLSNTKPILYSFKGGAFKSQIPEEAIAQAAGLNQKQIKIIKRVLSDSPANFQITPIGHQTLISVKGKAAHSSKPTDGVNAVAYLASALNEISWANNGPAHAVKYLSDLAGTDVYGKQFGNIAYSHPFMGPLTLSPTLVTRDDDGLLQVFINIRRPLGKTQPELRSQIEKVLSKWQQDNNVNFVSHDVYIGKPLLVDDAPHVTQLLDVFAHFTKTSNPQPIAIGGSTNAKLFPKAVSFGPSMPNTQYTGHSEHEFITEEQFALTLKMYTAMIIEIAAN